jgi:hypothetical protein
VFLRFGLVENTVALLKGMMNDKTLQISKDASGFAFADIGTRMKILSLAE